MTTTRVASASGAHVQTYTQPLMNGECDICKSDENGPLFRFHKPGLSKIPYGSSPEHGELTLNEKGRLGYLVTVKTHEKHSIDSTEGVTEVAKSFFKRVGESETDEKLYLYEDPHTACENCIKMMIRTARAARVLKCPHCRVEIPTKTFHFPPQELPPAAAAGSSTAEGSARSGLDFLAAAQRGVEDGSGATARRGHGRASAAQASIPEPVEDDFHPARSRRDRRTHAILPSSSPVTGTNRWAPLAEDSGYEDAGVSGVSTPSGAGARSNRERLDLRDMTPQDRALLKKLLEEEGMNNKRFAAAQNERFRFAARPHGASMAAAGSSGGTSTTSYVDGTTTQVNVSVRVRSTSRAAPPTAAAAPRSFRGMSALYQNPFIASLQEEGHIPENLLLDEDTLTDLILHEDAILARLEEGIPLTSIFREGKWFFESCLQFRPQADISMQIALSTSVEPASPLGKLYKACVLYAAGFDPEKAPAEAAIRSLIDSLGPDRDSVFKHIWIANGRPLTEDPLWAEHNTFHNPIALYEAVKRVIDHKLLTMSDLDWDRKMRSITADRSNPCMLADAMSL